MQVIKLVANHENWKIFMARKADPAFQRFTEKVFSRDKYACQYCGFQAKDYQEVVNADQNYQNNKISNLVTACCFCAQCFFLQAVGVGDYGGGTLIYAPEISQNNLNSFCHVLFCAIGADTGYKVSAEEVYRSLKFRSQTVEEQFGEGTSEPAVFGQMLIESGLKNKELDDALDHHLRLLPARARFKVQIEKWAETALKELSSDF